MKIGVDVRLLSRPITGIGRYTVEMCRVLSQIDGISLYLYSPSPINTDIANIFRLSHIKTGFFDNQLSRQYWSEFYLPKWAAQDNVDIFWGPAHRLPRNLPPHMASVVTIHDLVWKFAGETMRPLSRLLACYQMPSAIKKADHIVAVSEATGHALINEFHLQPEQLTVIPLGSNHLVPADNRQLLEKLNIVKPYGLFVGTLEPRKNLEHLLMAYAKLPEVIKQQASLVIAGGAGWGNIDLKKIIKKFDLTDDIKLLGFVDETTLRTLYTYAQFLAMPSLYEGFGLPLVEAMACGTPVLTSNNSSMIEVTGNAGILVDPYDIKAITNGLSEMMMNQTLRQHLAQNAKIRAQHFNWQISADKLLAVFKKVMIK